MPFPFDIEALKKCDIIITAQGGDYTSEVFPKLRAVIASPMSLEFRNGVLWHGDLAIDLIYNRLTD